jgi:hypothetical protein
MAITVVATEIGDVGLRSTITVATTDGGPDRRPIAANRSVNSSSGNSRSRSRYRNLWIELAGSDSSQSPGHRIQQVQLLRSLTQRHPTTFTKTTRVDIGPRHHGGHRLTPAT